jgi:hypothetical protein
MFQKTFLKPFIVGALGFASKFFESKQSLALVYLSRFSLVEQLSNGLFYLTRSVSFEKLLLPSRFLKSLSSFFKADTI